MYLFRIKTKILNGRDRKIPLVIEKRGHFRIDKDVRESSLFYHIDKTTSMDMLKWLLFSIFSLLTYTRKYDTNIPAILSSIKVHFATYLFLYILQKPNNI